MANETRGQETQEGCEHRVLQALQMDAMHGRKPVWLECSPPEFVLDAGGSGGVSAGWGGVECGEKLEPAAEEKGGGGRGDA